MSNKNKYLANILSFCSLIFCSCGQSNESSISSTEINEDYFAKQIETYGINLIKYDGNITQETIDSFSNNVGSQPYDALLSNIDSSIDLPSTDKDSFAYRASDGESIEKQRMVSVADKTPSIYLYSGNYHYPTGLCSNVVGIQAKSKSNITISNCIFENMSGVSLWNCSDIIIENCYFKGAENGIYLAKSSNITIRNCTFDMNSTGLTDYYQGVYLGDGNDGVNVTGCLFNADGDIKKPYRIGSKSEDYEPSKGVTFLRCVSKGHFRSGFQNIDGTASLTECTFFFDHDEGSYGNAIIIDDKNDATYTTLTDCSFYLSYRKKPSSSTSTKFESCTYNLYSL